MIYISEYVSRAEQARACDSIRDSAKPFVAVFTVLPSVKGARRARQQRKLPVR